MKESYKNNRQVLAMRKKTCKIHDICFFFCYSNATAAVALIMAPSSDICEFKNSRFPMNEKKKCEKDYF